MTSAGDRLLGAVEIRQLATELDLRPTKTLGQNFVHDANTVRRIVTAARIGDGDRVLEVGPGLGSLTLALLGQADAVTAIEIDPRLAARLPHTVADHLPERAGRLTVIEGDALRTDPQDLPYPPTALVANLPYNVGVPVLLHLLATVPSLARVLVMVQAEVADRLAAPPGSRTYGAPSAKLAWYGSARRAGSVPRSVFWPVPRVDSALVAVDCGSPARRGETVRNEARRGETLRDEAVRNEALRGDVFAVIDAAFSVRRKTLRSALATWAGSAAAAEECCRAAGVDPSARGETLGIDAYVALARQRQELP